MVVRDSGKRTDAKEIAHLAVRDEIRWNSQTAD
jgi:hypothetical protein